MSVFWKHRYVLCLKLFGCVYICNIEANYCKVVGHFVLDFLAECKYIHVDIIWNLNLTFFRHINFFIDTYFGQLYIMASYTYWGNGQLEKFIFPSVQLCKCYISLYFQFHKNVDGQIIRVAICAMAKKANSKPMKEILDRLRLFEHLQVTTDVDGV